jgi:type I restriction enzyme S subunit
MSFPRYERYKDSGVEWLGQVPEHWSIMRYKLVFRERNERSESGAETLLSVSSYTGVTPRSEIIDEGDTLMRADTLEGYKICYPGDLVVNIMLAWNRGLAFSTMHGVVSPAYCVYDVISPDSPQFLNYLVRSDRAILYYKAFSSGVIDSRLRIYPDVFGSLYCALPDRDEQDAIVALLDRETAKIDALIEEQRRLIELLKEKRQAVISYVVTKGLLEDVAMKSSGFQWLGEIPKHWCMTSVRRLSKFTTSGPRGWSDRISEDGNLFVQSGDLDDSLSVVFAGCKRVTVDDDAEATRTRLADGDVVVCITGAKTGKVAVCSSIPEPAYVNQHLCLIRLNAKVLPRYLGLLLKSDVGRTYFDLSQYGLKQGLSLEDVRDAPVPLPSLAEQLELCGYIDSKATDFDSLIMNAVVATELLQERRSALISAAVTGKIDVRNYTPKEAA